MTRNFKPCKLIAFWMSPILWSAPSDPILRPIWSETQNAIYMYIKYIYTKTSHDMSRYYFENRPLCFHTHILGFRRNSLFHISLSRVSRAHMRFTAGMDVFRKICLIWCKITRCVIAIWCFRFWCQFNQVMLLFSYIWRFVARPIVNSALRISIPM